MTGGLSSLHFHQALQKNLEWAKKRTAEAPGLFQKLSNGQEPKILYIGCSDSRVPETEIFGANPGDLFVHRNIANVVNHTDLSVLSVIQYAVDVLKVENIVVCGHMSCGGVKASMGDTDLGLIDNWLRNVKDLYNAKRQEIDALENIEDKENMLTELNVKRSVFNVCQSSFVQSAWKEGRSLAVHGVVYDIKTGIVNDLKVDIDSKESLVNAFRQ